MIHVETTYINNDGRELIVIHADNPFNAGITLCGNDYVGDSIENVNYSSENTQKKINCIDCIAMINFCKKFNKQSQFSKKRLSIAEVYD